MAYIISNCLNMNELVIESNANAYPRYLSGDVAREIGRASELKTLKLLGMNGDYNILPSVSLFP